jgi:hypothetical protein
MTRTTGTAAGPAWPGTADMTQGCNADMPAVAGTAGLGGMAHAAGTAGTTGVGDAPGTAGAAGRADMTGVWPGPQACRHSGRDRCGSAARRAGAAGGTAEHDRCRRVAAAMRPQMWPGRA